MQRSISDKIKSIRAVSLSPETSLSQPEDVTESLLPVPIELRSEEARELDPPPRVEEEEELEHFTNVYDTIFMLADEKHIDVEEEQELYKRVAESDKTFDSIFRNYENHGDISRLVSDLRAV